MPCPFNFLNTFAHYPRILTPQILSASTIVNFPSTPPPALCKTAGIVSVSKLPSHLLSQQIYANHTDISTSGAVIEIRFAYIVVFLALSAIAPMNLAGFFLAVALFAELKFENSAEASGSVYSSIGWILLIEITLFTGFLVTALVDLISDCDPSMGYLWRQKTGLLGESRLNSVKLAVGRVLFEMYSVSLAKLPSHQHIESKSICCRVPVRLKTLFCWECCWASRKLDSEDPKLSICLPGPFPGKTCLAPGMVNPLPQGWWWGVCQFSKTKSAFWEDGVCIFRSKWSSLRQRIT